MRRINYGDYKHPNSTEKLIICYIKGGEIKTIGGVERDLTILLAMPYAQYENLTFLLFLQTVVLIRTRNNIQETNKFGECRKCPITF